MLGLVVPMILTTLCMYNYNLQTIQTTDNNYFHANGIDGGGVGLNTRNIPPAPVPRTRASTRAITLPSCNAFLPYCNTYSVIFPCSTAARQNFNILYELPDRSIAPWQRFSLGLLLMFFIVFTYYVTNNTFHKWTGTSATAIGAVYFACGLVAVRVVEHTIIILL